MIRRFGKDRREAGTTLPEMLVVMSLFLLIGGLVATTTVFAQRQTGITETRQRNGDGARIAMEAMSKTLRTAIQPAQLQYGCLNCTGSAAGSSAVTSASTTSVRFFANLDNAGAGPTIVTFATTLDTTTNTGTLTQTLQAPNAGSAPNFTYCTPGPTCPVTTRTLVRGVAWPVSPAMFTFFDSSGATIATAADGTVPAASLADIDALDITITVDAKRGYASAPTTVTNRVQMPNSDTSVRPSATP
jgi:type II secretory pathway pseudopilin PulG